MTTAQKVIKYLALLFAAFIIINIISVMLIGIGTFSGILGLTENEKEQELYLEEIANIVNDKEIDRLDIELKYSELEIKQADILKVEANSKEIKCTQNNDKMIIKEKNRNWFSSRDTSKVILYIPKDTIFNEVSIEAGARKD